MLRRKQQFTSGWNVFLGKRSVTDEERSGWPATSRTEENIAKVCQIVRENRQLTVRSIAEEVNIDRETVRKILTEILDMRKVCAKMVPKELTEEQEQRSHNLPRPFGEARWHFGPWWNMGLPIRPWNEVAKCTMDDCQFPMTKKVPSVQIQSQTNVADFFWY